MTELTLPASLRPRQNLNPEDIRPGLLMQAAVGPINAPVPNCRPMGWHWVMVQRLGQYHGQLCLAFTYEAAEGFCEEQCFLADVFTLWRGTVAERAVKPFIPQLDTATCMALHTLLRRARVRAAWAEREALALWPATLPRANTLEAYNRKAELQAQHRKANAFALRARNAALIIEGNMRAWGLAT